MSHRNLQEPLRRVARNTQLLARMYKGGARVTGEVLPTLRVDATHIHQLIQNLIAYGLKFNRPGVAPHVLVSAARDGNVWTFAFATTASASIHSTDRILVLFQRLHTRADYSGTGIGLAICNKIVDRHGGSIWLESQLHRGTTFFSTLPEAK